MEMDFVSYPVFLSVGMVLGAAVGRRFMRWAWNQGQVPENKGWLELLLLVVMVAAFAARRGG